MKTRNRQKTSNLRSLAGATIRRRLNGIYSALARAYGPRHWWPGDSPTEVIIGAILTQNTSWKNVERALAALRQRQLINWHRLRRISTPALATIIRPAGYHHLKAQRLKNFVAWLFEKHTGTLDSLSAISTADLRCELLGINGVGPETADAILLYALDRASFVVDQYTGRLARRHLLIANERGYESLKSLFESHLPRDIELFNEFHALIVEVGKRHCGRTARCGGCPLARFRHDSTLNWY